jgi:very-short-patch-repair endonuclease
MRGTTKGTVAKARGLRRTMSRPEARLWQVLRTRPDGLKFRRQHPVGPYVLDFYCPAAKLAVEVDGEAHGMGENPARDSARDAWLRERGFRLCRIPARHLYGDIEPAVNLILAAARSR